MGSGQLAEAGPPLAHAAVRAFFGLAVPEDQRRVMGSYLEACATAAPAFRWTPAANLHLTLRFFGQVERSVAESVLQRLAARDPRGFEVRLGEVGTFRRGPRVRVVWLGLRSGADEARLLAVDIESECAAAGLVAESRPLQPHLTLARARAREGSALPELPPLPDLPAWQAGEVVLYRSRLGRAGAVYEPLREFRLS